ncbi:DUF4350 domain-containing protein [Plantactinospora soyae]|uniref:DUF4350 domain-containing protein n=1 Tax=Plantactinospora soyae TaxID=1544732 RepID=A0A927QZ81_9ACTN|nr:DUF4350 domain-containing protein [Plantactinospora soyae]MBE1487318.1 hypothetical protein [Plantactinospora soyae]
MTRRSEEISPPRLAGRGADGRPGPTVAGSTRRRRWHRIVVPIGLVVLLLVVTWIAQAVDQPDRDDPGFLSSVNSDDDGGSRLAAQLRARGVAIQRTTSTRRALSLAPHDGFTLFVPAPALVHPLYLPLLVDPAERARVVLVDPSQRVLDDADMPLTAADRRLAARTVPTAADGRPCALPEVRAAGPAAALRQRYTDAPGLSYRADRCYDGGLARSRWRGNDVVVVGASDPFRNDRIDEAGNTALAAGLLSAHNLVIWLDLDGPEPPPPYHPDGELGPWSPMPGEPTPFDAGDPNGQRGNGSGEDEEPRPSQRANPPDQPNPLWDAFPPWFWALLVQLAVAVLLAMLWRARRLGPPVTEPLPVTVASAETVFGRGRLYQQARAYGPTADTLRAATLHRLLPAFNLPPDTGPDEVAGAVAARTGWSRADAYHLLYGPAPTTNQELLDLARALDVLSGLLAHPPTDPPRYDRPVEGEAR